MNRIRVRVLVVTSDHPATTLTCGSLLRCYPLHLKLLVAAFACMPSACVAPSSQPAADMQEPPMPQMRAEQASLEPSSGDMDPSATEEQSADLEHPMAGEDSEISTAGAIDPEGDETAPLNADQHRAEFCADDIYSRHLIREYRRSLASGKGKVRDENDDMAARLYARRRLLGDAAPYFGAIPIVANQRVERWLHYFKTAGRSQFMRWLARGEIVRETVQPLLQDKGVPPEFFYLAMVESGFSNRAYSRKKATGTWQFMPSTALNYGLRINYWVDERRDPIKSTIAAANYLLDLYAQLDDWYLAMAAYNAGPGKVRKAMRRVQSRDFWTLANSPHLARETKNYVPKVLAAVLLASDMAAHGFKVTEGAQDYAIPDTEVLLQRPVRLDEVATLLGIERSWLKIWNPELIRDITPPARNSYALRLPKHLAQKFVQIEARLSTLNISDVQLHTIGAGDTLKAIARRYGTGVNNIISVNPKLDERRLRIGQKLAIPVPAVATASSKPSRG